MRRTKIGIASSTLLLLTACAGDDHRDLQQFVSQAGENLRGHVAPVAQIKSPEQFVYQAFQQTDPFRADRLQPREARVKGSAWTPPERREALEAWPLDALHMVGTLERGGKRWALVKAPDNAVYRIAPGNRIGQNFGAVALVTETSITLSEHVQEGSGWTERTTSLALQEQGDTK